MILYHGSNTDIKQIDLEKCRPYKDFGKGFYLTNIEEQAKKMARRVATIYGGKPCINTYEVDEEFLYSNEISVRIFEKPTKEWGMFVINNCNKNFGDSHNIECNVDFKYDIVVGPIANDDLALLFRQFSDKLISIDVLVKEMEYKKLTNQYSFHSEKAITRLIKVGAKYE